MHNPMRAETADFKIDDIDYYIPQRSCRLISTLSEIKARHFMQLTVENLHRIQCKGRMDY